MHRLGLAQIPEGKLDELAHQYKYATADDFLAAVGYGELSPHAVIMKMALVPGDEGDELKSIPLIPQVEPTARVLVRGERGVFTTVAACCQPVPGDAIIGYTTRGKGVTVHRSDCVNAVNAVEKQRIVPVDWDAQATHLYPVAIKIEAWDRTGLLRDIAAAIAESKINLSGADVQVFDDRTAVISTIVEIQSLTQLSRLLERLEAIRDVHTVAREAS